jgi:hypothetical protein
VGFRNNDPDKVDATIDSVLPASMPGLPGPANGVVAGQDQHNGKQLSVYQRSFAAPGPLIEARVAMASFGAPVPSSMVNPLVANS